MPRMYLFGRVTGPRAEIVGAQGFGDRGSPSATGSVSQGRRMGAKRSAISSRPVIPSLSQLLVRCVSHFVDAVLDRVLRISFDLLGVTL